MSKPFPEIKSKDSLIFKHLTEEIWNRLCDHETKTCGFTLEKAIQNGVQFDDQHIGIYAGDEDSYTDFGDIFNPLICEYHNVAEDFKHTSDMEPLRIRGNIHPLAPIHSTRIRVGRNVVSYGLSPGITKEQRLDVENAAKSAFGKLTDELSGQYHPLVGMEEDVKQKLIDDHFLFMSGDKAFQASGMARDWPEGRGIFFNEDENFLVWVNEEDHFRIISMQKGGDVLEVFTRLVNGIEAMKRTIKGETGKDFMFSEKFGYIHSCPTNLGTGMRASVHIDLPGWTKEGLSALKKRCEVLSLQPRGTKGESGGDTGVTYDISNKHRLGYTEVQLVQTMIKGVNVLYEEDLELQKKHEYLEERRKRFPTILSKNSLVAKYVTEDKWKSMCQHKTKTCGFTLAQAIACAVEFDDQHVGIYAGDENCYKDFAGVFNPIICDYHKIGDDFRHISDLDVSKISGNINENAPVHSTRIRVGRNVEGYGLSPGISAQQRLEIENAAKVTFSKLDGELSGSYQPLLGMNEKVRLRLVEDHYLFITGDRNLQAAGMERDWPEGRGIFLNEDKTFLVWVNEEDQFRIISMQKGGDVLAVFTRLVKGIEQMGTTIKEETKSDFMYSEKFGFIHSCPTNLGTGMRASVHIDLPGWAKEGIPALKKRCEELSLQPRGTRGESGGETGVTYDISNKHRLGYTEVQLVQTMINGVNTLYEEDLELQNKHGTGINLPSSAEPTEKVSLPMSFPTINSKESLVAKYLTEDIWNKLCHHKTKTSEFTLNQAIACAVQFDDQHVGIYAGDGDCYDDFFDIFNPIICDYHKIGENFKHTSDLDLSKITGNINDNAPVNSTRIRVGRNVSGYGLSPGITKQQRIDIESAAKTSFDNLSGNLRGTYHPLIGMEEDVRQKMVDDHFLFMSGDKNLQASGMERDWPEGRGIFFNNDKNFLVWVNEEDQFRIISMQKGGDVLSVFKRLVDGIESMGNTIKVQTGKEFMFSEKYGFIHSCPTNLGTGMRASVHIDLPGWNKKGFTALRRRCEELSLQPRGTRGESGGQTGITYDISNKHRLGYTEVQLVQTMINGVNTLYEEDLELQKKHGLLNTEESPISSVSSESSATSSPTFAPSPTPEEKPPVISQEAEEKIKQEPKPPKLLLPIIKSRQSLVAKYLTEDIWNTLCQHKTKTSEFTLRQAIACAVEFTDQHVGIYAGDEDCYKDFADLFNPIICDYHKVEKNFRHTSDLQSKIKGNIHKNAPVHSTRIRVGRNLVGYGLSPGISKQQRLDIEKAAKKSFEKLDNGLGGKYYQLLGMKEDVRKKMVEDHFLFMSGDKNLQASGMERDWPEGRGIFLNEAKNFLVWVNEEDQFRIISMQKGGDVLAVFNRLVKGIKSMSRTLIEETGKDFMFNDKIGFIHSCPTNLGTGMRASVHIDLPGWAKEGLPELKKRCEELSLQPRGTQGESGGQTGVTYDISNKHRLGYTEVQLVQTMINGVNTLFEEDIVLQRKHGLIKKSGFCTLI